MPEERLQVVGPLAALITGVGLALGGVGAILHYPAGSRGRDIAALVFLIGGIMGAIGLVTYIVAENVNRKVDK